jgi:hypothetical protein
MTDLTGVRKSSNYGVIWEEVSNFPSLSWDASIDNQKNAVVYNLGDANNWLVAFNRTVQMEPGHVDDRIDRLQIWYTLDFGVTWQDWSGDLPTNGDIAEGAKVLVIRNA